MKILWGLLVAGVLTGTAACGPRPPVPLEELLATEGSVPDALPPSADGSVRFAVLGDSGTGDLPQYEVAAQLIRARSIFPFEFVIMLGDNMYGPERPQDYARKFEVPYKPLLDAKVPFYASLGNHDDPSQRLYAPFNMNGDRYYTFNKSAAQTPDVQFFALDSTYMSRDQLTWLERQLAGSTAGWKIAFFHHPLYSSGGRHGSELDLREALEPLFVTHGVHVVFAGHEHLYERVKPQKGVAYFTAGASAKLRAGNLRKTDMTAAGYDQDRSFMLVEVARGTMHFQAITRAGRRVDAGTISVGAGGVAVAPLETRP